MNKKRRSSLEKANLYLDLAMDVVQDAKYEEEDCLNNLPENLENSAKYQDMDSAVDYLDDALNAIKDARDYVSSAIDC